MSKEVKSYLSVFFIISALLTIVILKMEVRRLGYQVFKLGQVERTYRDDYRKLEMRFAQLTRPERIEIYAQTKLELKEANKGQIIQLIAGKVAFKN